jgi:DNA-binding HxlR family transcriptional regulator
MKGGIKIKIRKDYTCPLEIVHDIMKGKWKTIIIFQLQYGKATLSQLEKAISGINQKMLMEQLKELQAFGLINKHTFSGYPLRVEYSLTEYRGKKMLEAIKIMQEIGKDYINNLE